MKHSSSLANFLGRSLDQLQRTMVATVSNTVFVYLLSPENFGEWLYNASEGREPGNEATQYNASEGREPGNEATQYNASEGREPGNEATQYNASEGREPGNEATQGALCRYDIHVYKCVKSITSFSLNIEPSMQIC